MFHCKTGKKISKEEMRLWIFDQGSDKESIAFSGSPGDGLNDSFSMIPGENVNFRMQRYEINKKANDHIVWKTSAGLSILRTGACIVLEDILFLGPWRDEPTDLIRRQFIANLKQLPEWNQTKYYCPAFPLRECKTLNREGKYKQDALTDKKTTKNKDHPSSHRRDH